jgi:hypothetical protein
LGRFADEAFGMDRVGGVQNHLTMGQDVSGLAVVDLAGVIKPSPE